MLAMRFPLNRCADQGGGNTKSPPDAKKKYRAYCFTVNNYDEMEHKAVIRFVSSAQFWIVGHETGKKNGTPHLQGYMRWKSPKSWGNMKKNLPHGTHIEVARGTTTHNYKYCSKDCEFETNIEESDLKLKLTKQQLEIKKQKAFDDKVRTQLMKRYEGIVWKDWQSEIIDVVNSEPDERTIHWYWESTGGVGKSFLCKFLVMTKICVLSSGKKGDIFHQVLSLMKPKDILNVEPKLPEVIIVDAPRTAIEYVNYGVLEELKNGCLYSGKYEGGQCIFPPPHVIVFANTPPKLAGMSADRWHVVNMNPVVDAIAEFSKLC